MGLSASDKWSRTDGGYLAPNDKWSRLNEVYLIQSNLAAIVQDLTNSLAISCPDEQSRYIAICTFWTRCHSYLARLFVT